MEHTRTHTRTHRANYAILQPVEKHGTVENQIRLPPTRTHTHSQTHTNTHTADWDFTLQ